MLFLKRRKAASGSTARVRGLAGSFGTGHRCESVCPAKQIVSVDGRCGKGGKRKVRNKGLGEEEVRERPCVKGELWEPTKTSFTHGV